MYIISTAPTKPVIQKALQDRTILRLESVTINVGKSVTTLTGNTITIKCNATGIPEPSLQWFKDNKKIDNTDVSLKINPQKSDSGVYSCVAENLAGVTKASTKLTIFGEWQKLGFKAVMPYTKIQNGEHAAEKDYTKHANEASRSTYLLSSVNTCY